MSCEFGALAKNSAVPDMVEGGAGACLEFCSGHLCSKPSLDAGVEVSGGQSAHKSRVRDVDLGVIASGESSTRKWMSSLGRESRWRREGGPSASPSPGVGVRTTLPGDLEQVTSTLCLFPICQLGTGLVPTSEGECGIRCLVQSK